MPRLFWLLISGSMVTLAVLDAQETRLALNKTLNFRLERCMVSGKNLPL